MPNKKRRFFTISDSVEEKDSESTLAENLKPESLFVESDDEVQILESKNDVSSPVDQIYQQSSRQVFSNMFTAVVGETDILTIEKLYNKFRGSSDVLNEALDYYFKNKDERTDGNQNRSKRLRGEVAIDKMDIETTKEGQKEMIANEELQTNENWSKYIGSIEVQAWATRPTFKGLAYMDELEVKHVKSNTRKFNGDTVRLFTVDKTSGFNGREIGRIPEDWTRILVPLLDFDLAEFKVLVIVPSSQRLSIGDSFYIQIECFLKKQAFSESTETFIHDKQSLDEQNNDVGRHLIKNGGLGFNVEKRFKLRQFAISRLFDNLSIRPTSSRRSPRSSQDISNGIDVVESEDEDAADLSTKDIDNLSIEDFQGFYDQTTNNELFDNLPNNVSPPSENFNLILRGYQRKGLAWMLTRENEYLKLETLMKMEHEMTSSQINQKLKEKENDSIHPLWKVYEWPQKNSMAQGCKGYFYANMYSGELSLAKPVISAFSRGGILADEMGLGKTISLLSLVHSVPYDINNIDNKAKGSFYAHQSTLLIVPMSLLSQWKSEFQRSNNNENHKCIVYYGESTEADLSYTLSIKSKGIPVLILTTYGTVVNEYIRMKKLERQNTGKRHKYGLFSVKFFRIVLDEAHIIRNTSTKTSKAVCELSSSRKWVLTGTPIINKLDDLYSLLRFLRIEPWANVAYWKTFVTLPFEQRQISHTLDVVRSILNPIFLRRTKSMKAEDGSMLISLPEKEVRIEEVEFSSREEIIYNSFKSEAAHSLNESIKSGQVLKKYSQILTHILRLRQICCHTNLVGTQSELEDMNEIDVSHDTFEAGLNKISERNKMDLERENRMKQVKKDITPRIDFRNSECSICMQLPIMLGELVVVPCSHTFCFTCIVDFINYSEKLGKKASCPVCRSDMYLDELLTVKDNSTRNRFQVENKQVNGNLDFDLQLYDATQYSSKIHALIKHLRIMKEKCPGEQLIVFSQFASYLDIIENVLKSGYDQEFIIYKFSGRISLAEREKILEKFSDKSQGKGTITILLITLKTGGVGLNLTTCSTAIIMDPWWSPNIEDQAIDRIHRIGQDKSVKVIRLIIKNSIEQKILQIQERKKQLGEAVGIEEEERRKQRIEEIQSLFEE